MENSGHSHLRGKLVTIELAKCWLHLRNLELASRDVWEIKSGYWLLLLMRRGRGALHNGKWSGVLKAGELGVLPAGFTGRLEASERANVQISTISFPSVWLERQLSLGDRLALRHAASAIDSLCVLSRTSSLREQVNELLLRTSLSDQDENEFLFNCDVAAPLFDELTKFLLESTQSARGTPARIFDVLGSVNDTDLEALSNDDLADRCGCTRRHLNRLVRDLCDSSLATIRVELRLDRAAKLLRTTDDKVTDVALECGFNHVGAFTAKFKSRFGVTPGEWRKVITTARLDTPEVPIRREQRNGTPLKNFASL